MNLHIIKDSESPNDFKISDVLDIYVYLNITW